MKYHDDGRRILNIQDAKKITCISFMFGFLLGIIYSNIIAREYIIATGIFEDHFLQNFSANDLNTNIFIWYIIKIRFIPFLFLIVVSNTRYRRILTAIFLIWTGFSCGLILTAAILKLGIKGIGICVAGTLPHFVSYIIAYVMMFVYAFTYPAIKWNSTKTVSFILFILLGIITEVYINPVLMDIIIKML